MQAGCLHHNGTCPSAAREDARPPELLHLLQQREAADGDPFGDEDVAVVDPDGGVGVDELSGDELFARCAAQAGPGGIRGFGGSYEPDLATCTAIPRPPDPATAT